MEEVGRGKSGSVVVEVGTEKVDYELRRGCSTTGALFGAVEAFGIEVTYGADGRDIGINYQSTTARHADGFLTEWSKKIKAAETPGPGQPAAQNELTDLEEKVSLQLQAMAQSTHISVVSTDLVLARIDQGEAPNPVLHFPPSAEEMDALGRYAQMVADEGLKLALGFVWLSCADFKPDPGPGQAPSPDPTPNCPGPYPPVDCPDPPNPPDPQECSPNGFINPPATLGTGCTVIIDGAAVPYTVTAAEWTTRAQQSITNVLTAVSDVTLNGRPVVERIYLDTELRVAADCDDDLLPFARRNGWWFLKDSGLYEYFWEHVTEAGIIPSLHLIAVHGEEILKGDYVDPGYPELNGHRSMNWVYRTLRFLRDNGLPIPQRIDVSFYPHYDPPNYDVRPVDEANNERPFDEADEYTRTNFATLIHRILADFQATIPALVGVDSMEFYVAETWAWGCENQRTTCEAYCNEGREDSNNVYWGECGAPQRQCFDVGDGECERPPREPDEQCDAPTCCAAEKVACEKRRLLMQKSFASAFATHPEFRGVAEWGTPLKDGNFCVPRKERKIPYAASAGPPFDVSGYDDSDIVWPVVSNGGFETAGGCASTDGLPNPAGFCTEWSLGVSGWWAGRTSGPVSSGQSSLVVDSGLCGGGSGTCSYPPDPPGTLGTFVQSDSLAGLEPGDWALIPISVRYESQSALPMCTIDRRAAGAVLRNSSPIDPCDEPGESPPDCDPDRLERIDFVRSRDHFVDYYLLRQIPEGAEPKLRFQIVDPLHDHDRVHIDDVGP